MDGRMDGWTDGWMDGLIWRERRWKEGGGERGNRGVYGLAFLAAMLWNDTLWMDGGARSGSIRIMNGMWGVCCLGGRVACGF